MTRHITPTQLVNNIAQVNRALARLATYAHELARWETEANKGFPSTGGEGRNSKGDHADPTYRAYLEGLGLSDEIAHWFNVADNACAAIIRADGLGASLMPIDHNEWLRQERDAKGEGCCICHRHDIWSAIYKAGRCTACWWYRHRHDGQDTPENVIREREGKRTA